MATYNEAHFPNEQRDKIAQSIDMVEDCEQMVLDVLKTFLVSTRNYEQKENFTPFIHLAIKMRFNLDAAHQLLPSLRSDYRFKTSINLLYRACLDDTVNLYYLLGFVMVDNATKTASEKQPFLGYELDILHRDFMKSVVTIIESEVETAQYYAELNGGTYSLPDHDKNWKQDLIDANQDIYNETTQAWKNNKEIRGAEPNNFTDKYPSGNGKIAETGKMEFIKNRGYQRHSTLTQLFKYFSQYQHFSPKMHQFLLTTPENDLRYYHMMLVEILCVVFECNQILVTDDQEGIRSLFKQCIKDIFERYHQTD